MSIPCETAYMDDVNLYSTDRQHLACALTEAEVVFKEWNLNINPTKTEWTHLYQEEAVARRGEERWRSTRLLGSLYGVTEDLKRRRQQAAAAFNTLVNLWMRRQAISEATRWGCLMHLCYLFWPTTVACGCFHPGMLQQWMRSTESSSAVY